MVAAVGPGARGLRDRALLLLGFAGAFRRSELVALDLEDLAFCNGGVRVTIDNMAATRRPMVDGLIPPSASAATLGVRGQGREVSCVAPSPKKQEVRAVGT